MMPNDYSRPTWRRVFKYPEESIFRGTEVTSRVLAITRAILAQGQKAVKRGGLTRRACAKSLG